MLHFRLQSGQVGLILILHLALPDALLIYCQSCRYGGNIYDGDAISDIGDLYPGAVVEKVGRTSGTTFGTVNPASLVVWDQGSPTFEIAIIGIEGDTFAQVGDSGGCVFENQDGTYKAAGLLIGKNYGGVITYATPLRLLLQTAGDYQWAHEDNDHMPSIIDSHVHLFTREHLPHLAWSTPENSLSEENSILEYLSGIPPKLADFKGFVFIEADRLYTIPSDEAISQNDTVALKKAWQWSLEDFEFVYGLSKTDPYGMYVLGIVPWAPMNLGALAVERFYELLGVEGEGGVDRKRMLKGFRYQVQDKPSGTIGEVRFRESMEWVWKKGLVVEIGVNTRNGGLWQLEEAVKAVQHVVKDSKRAGGVGAFVISQFTYSYTPGNNNMAANL